MEEDGDCISVTHFINPQLFWYQKVDVRSDNLMIISQLEEELNELFKGRPSQCRPHPEVGALIAARFLPWNKFIRVRILRLIDVGRETEIIVWAMDYGFPFRTTGRETRLLPDARFTRSVDHVRRGGISDIQPADKEFDFIQGEAIMTIKPNWPDRACNSLQDLIHDAVYISFLEHFQQENGHYWGALQIVKHEGQKFDAATYLKAINCAIDAKDNFMRLCGKFTTTQLPWYMSNNGLLKMRDNVFVIKGRDTEQRANGDVFNYDDDCDEYAKRKVQDWCERNNRILSSGTGALTGADTAVGLPAIGALIQFNGSSILSPEINESASQTHPQSASERSNHFRPFAAASALSEDALFVLDERRDSRHPQPLPAAPSDRSASSTMSIRKQKLVELSNKLGRRECVKPQEDHLAEVPKPQPLVSQHDSYVERRVREVPPPLPAPSGRTSRQDRLVRLFHDYCESVQGTPTAEQTPNDAFDLTELSPGRNGITAAGAVKKHSPPCSISSERAMQLMGIRRKVIEKYDMKTGNSQHFFEENPIPAMPEKLPTGGNKMKELYEREARNVRLIPAGFDLMRLNEYKDQNHWHIQKTMRDQAANFSQQLSNNNNNNNNNSTMSSAEIPLLRKNSSSSNSSWAAADLNGGPSDIWPLLAAAGDGSETDTLSKLWAQNFRHAKPQTGRYKNTLLAETAAKPTSPSDRHILDASFTELSGSLLQPVAVQTPKPSVTTSTSSNSTPGNSNTGTTNRSPTILHNNSNATTTNVRNTPPARCEVAAAMPPTGQRRMRRQLKSPTLQKGKIDEILRRAKYEKDLGDANILDLSSLNTSGSRTGSDVTPLSDDTKQPFKQNQAAEKKLEFVETKVGKTSTTDVVYSRQSLNIEDVGGLNAVKSNYLENTLLAHANVPVKVLQRFEEAFLLEEIQKEMMNMRMTKVFRIQAYGWPHLLRGNSLFVVNPARSGKTWSYLPPICSLVCYRQQSGTLPDRFGPVAIVLVPSAKQAEHIFKYCQRLLVRTTVTAVACFGMRNAQQTKMELLNGCGILIITPPNLQQLLCDEEASILFDPQRLQHFVIDDMHRMLARADNVFAEAVEGIFKLGRRCGRGGQQQALQLIVTSRDWSSKMITFIRDAHQPLLLIGDFLEATVYARSRISIEFSSSHDKATILLRFVDQFPRELHRLLIFCNHSSDVETLVSLLSGSGYYCVGYSSQGAVGGGGGDDVLKLIASWKKRNNGLVVVCSDAVFPELQIQNAYCIVHYSMPSSWTKFTGRFSALAQSYDNLVANDFAALAEKKAATAVPTVNSGGTKPEAFILLDEENSEQLPRLHDFLRRHEQLKHISPSILRVMESVLLDREKARAVKDVPLCPRVLEFGDCDESYCVHRHKISCYDAVRKEDDIPQSGDLRILVLEVFSPTHYVARLLQHKRPLATQWRDVRRSSEAAIFAMKLNLHYTKESNLQLYWPLQLNALCICKTKETFQRARIVELPTIKYTDVVQKVKVVVKLIDAGITKPIDSDELYVCEEAFQHFPAQAIEIRLRGIVPYGNERSWDTLATKSVQKWIKTGLGKHECVHVSVNFAFAQTIWVNNVIVMERLSTVGQYVYTVNLRRSLLEKHFGTIAQETGEHVRDLAMKFGLLSSDDAADGDGEDKAVGSVIAAVDGGGAAAAVRQEKKPPKMNDSNLIDFTKDEECIQQFTDDGEDWDEELQNMPAEKMINLPLPVAGGPKKPSAPQIAKEHQRQLPANCESWLALPTRRLAKVEIGNEEDNGNWVDIYMQCVDAGHQQHFHALLGVINEHVAKLKEMPEQQHTWSANELRPWRNCIVKYLGLYLRAKIAGRLGDVEASVDDCIYRFFLCDYACFITAKGSEIFNDFLFDTTKRIVEFTPYQAVHCRLAGIQLDPFGKRCKVTKDLLYAYNVGVAVSEEELPDFVSGLGLKSFSILLYECVQENDMASALMLNTQLVEKAVAVFDSRTRHFLEEKPQFEAQVVEQISDTSNDVEEEEEEDSNVEGDIGCGFANFDQFMQHIQKMCDMQEADEAANKADATAEDETVNIAEKTSNPPLSQSSNASAENGNCSIALLSHKESTAEDKEMADRNDSETSSMSPPMPHLRRLNKCPPTMWYQTDCVIYLIINVPDVRDYYLQVNRNTVYFDTTIAGEQYVLILNLLGFVRTEWVSHEIRGLNVVVRLWKSIYMEWPRLLAEDMKWPWLTYSMNAIIQDELDNLVSQQRLRMLIDEAAQLKNSNAIDSDADDDDELDDEKQFYQNHVPIHNSEDFHDPISELY